LWLNLILEKSHSSTTTGHFAATTLDHPLPDRCIQAKWHCRFDYAWMFGAGQIRIVDAAEAMGLDLGTAELLQDPPMLTAAEVTEFVSTAPC